MKSQLNYDQLTEGLLKATGGVPAPGRPSDDPWAPMHFIR